MSLNHEKVYRIAKKDKQFRAELLASGQKMPVVTFDTLERGIWAAGYAGWILGSYGAEVYKERHAEWERL